MCLAQRLLHIGYHSHWCLLVGLYGYGLARTVFVRHAMTLCRHESGNVRRRCNAVVYLHLKSIVAIARCGLAIIRCRLALPRRSCRSAYVDIRHSRLLRKACQFGALRHTEAYLQRNRSHVRHHHKEEQHGEDKVGQRRSVQLRHLSAITIAEYHGLPPFCIVPSAPAGAVVVAASADVLYVSSMCCGHAERTFWRSASDSWA